MHVDDAVPVFLAHLVEHGVAQDAGRIDHRMQAAEAVHGLLDHALHGLQRGDAFGVGDRLAAGGADFLGHGFGRTGRTFVAAREAAAEVVDQDLGAVGRRDQGAVAADAVAAAGNENHLA